MHEKATARGLSNTWGGLLLLLVLATGAASCARVATSGHRTAGDPEAMAGERATTSETTTPFSTVPIDDNPIHTGEALKDVPIIKHALEQPHLSPGAPAEAQPPALMPNPFPSEPGPQGAADSSELDPATIAVQQLMMKQADAELEHDRGSTPEPDFKGMGKAKQSASSTASDDLELDVVGYLARQHRKIKTCYEMGLAADPTIEGKITVEFKVSRKGKVKRPRVVASDMPRSVERCILHTLKRLDFPENDDPKAVFEYPFFFAR